MTPSNPTPARAPIRLTAQILTCLAYCLIAALLLYFAQPDPRAVFTRPLTPMWQLLIGQGLSLVAAVGTYALFRHATASAAASAFTAHTIAGYKRLDVRGLNPLWIALAAAIGTEMLFRAALQPLLGIWITSAVFLVTHMPLSGFRKRDQATLAQAAMVFGGSLALGLIFDRVGWLAALLVHLWIDIVGLLVVRASLRTE